MDERELEHYQPTETTAAPVLTLKSAARHRKHVEHHGNAFSSFTVRFEAPVPWHGFAVSIGRILGSYGQQLLRVKGLIAVAGDPQPHVIQCVQDVAYPPVRLQAWPNDGAFADRCGRLVFIVQDLAPAAVDAIRGALADLPGVVAAARISATHPLLPTRCWLTQQMPVTPCGGWSSTLGSSSRSASRSAMPAAHTPEQRSQTDIADTSYPRRRLIVLSRRH
ncbi:GTP-binding protein [Azotobacter sp. CWF10]